MQKSVRQYVTDAVLSRELLFAFSVQYKEVKKIGNKDLHVEKVILIWTST
jgi:hypothetical protein